MSRGPGSRIRSARRGPAPPPRARGRTGTRGTPTSEAARVPRPPVELEVERLSADGEGVATWNGRALFVPGALPGEAVRIVPTVEGKVQRGALLEVVRPAPERIVPGCPVAEICGGCDWLHLAPAAQRRERERAVRAALERLGGLDLSAVRWLPTVAAGDLGTRRRADLTWTGTALGYLHRRSHDSVPVAHCPALVGFLADLPGRLTPLLLPLGRRLRAVRLLAEGSKISVALELAGALTPRAREVGLALVRTGVRGVVLMPPRRVRARTSAARRSGGPPHSTPMSPSCSDPKPLPRPTPRARPFSSSGPWRSSRRPERSPLSSSTPATAPSPSRWPLGRRRCWRSSRRRCR